MAVEMQLGGQIRDHREAMGLSQDDLASKIFVSRQTVSNWETGRTYPDVQNLLLLGNLFGITLDELVKGDVEKMNEEIKRNRRKILLWTFVTWVLFAFCLVFAFSDAYTHGRYWNKWWSLISIPEALATAGAAVHCDKLQKKLDVITFRELLAYVSGKPVDRTHRNNIVSIAAGVLVILLFIGTYIWLSW